MGSSLSPGLDLDSRAQLNYGPSGITTPALPGSLEGKMPGPAQREVFGVDPESLGFCLPVRIARLWGRVYTDGRPEEKGLFSIRIHTAPSPNSGFRVALPALESKTT